LCESFKENGARKELLEIVRDVNMKMAERHQKYTPDISSMTLTKACYFGKTRRGNLLIAMYFKFCQNMPVALRNSLSNNYCKILRSFRSFFFKITYLVLSRKERIYLFKW
jgi:hypothetical protein